MELTKQTIISAVSTISEKLNSFYLNNKGFTLQNISNIPIHITINVKNNSEDVPVLVHYVTADLENTIDFSFDKKQMNNLKINNSYELETQIVGGIFYGLLNELFNKDNYDFWLKKVDKTNFKPFMDLSIEDSIYLCVLTDLTSIIFNFDCALFNDYSEVFDNFLVDLKEFNNGNLNAVTQSTELINEILNDEDYQESYQDKTSIFNNAIKTFNKSKDRTNLMAILSAMIGLWQQYYKDPSNTDVLAFLLINAFAMINLKA